MEGGGERMERAGGRLKWQGGAIILVRADHNIVRRDAVMLTIRELFGEAHPAAEQIVSDPKKMSEWMACVERLPLSTGELAPVLALPADKVPPERMLAVRPMLSERVPLVLYGIDQTVGGHYHGADIVIDCLPDGGMHDARSVQAPWRLHRSRFQDVAHKEPPTGSPVEIGVVKFYFERWQATGVGCDWRSFVEGWMASQAWANRREDR
jgi:hypothetical protein